MRSELAKLYQDKVWLETKYWGEELSTYAMAKLAGCCDATIGWWMRKHDIPRRSLTAAWAIGRCRDAHSKAMRQSWARGDFTKWVAWTRSEEGREWRSQLFKKVWQEGKMDNRDNDSWRTDEWKQKCREQLRRQWRDSEYRKKMTEMSCSLWRNPEYRANQAERMRQAWATGLMSGSMFRSPTSIELEVAAALEIMGIEHQSQYRPDGYSRIYDEFVPPSLLIEVHGDYWHSVEYHPKVVKRDAEKLDWANSNGYQLITMWEHEIHQYGAWALVHHRVWPLLSA